MPVRETQDARVQSLGLGDLLQEEMAILPYSCLGPGGLQSMGSQRVGHNLEAYFILHEDNLYKVSWILKKQTSRYKKAKGLTKPWIWHQMRCSSLVIWSIPMPALSLCCSVWVKQALDVVKLATYWRLANDSRCLSTLGPWSTEPNYLYYLSSSVWLFS